MIADLPGSTGKSDTGVFQSVTISVTFIGQFLSLLVTV